MLGTTCWSGNSNQARYGTVYQLDENQNATFPAQVTATKFKGALTNTIKINGKTYNGSAAVDVGVIGAAYGGSGKTTLKESANVFINALDTASATPQDAQIRCTAQAAGTLTFVCGGDVPTEAVTYNVVVIEGVTA